MIKKFKTIQESNEPLWILNPDEKYYSKVDDFFLMLEKLSGFKVQRGIQKIKNSFPENKQVRKYEKP